MISPLSSITMLSPHHKGIRTLPVDRITIHCVVGQATAEAIGAWFQIEYPRHSCNYGIGRDGKIVCCLPEEYISMCSSSYANDSHAITIECASDTMEPYRVNPAVYQSVIALCSDICKRYQKTKIVWFADKEKTLDYEPASNEMVFTVHRWFDNKSCPGDYLYYSLGDIANKATKDLKEDDLLIYNTLDEVPIWAKSTVSKLIEKKVLNGTNDGLSLSVDMLRVFVILDRLGLFDK